MVNATLEASISSRRGGGIDKRLEGTVRYNGRERVCDLGRTDVSECRRIIRKVREGRLRICKLIKIDLLGTNSPDNPMDRWDSFR